MNAVRTLALLVVAACWLLPACRRRTTTPAAGGVEADAHEDPTSAPSRDVTTESGIVRGVVHGETFAFRGIPYAAPPVGALRFVPPRPVAAWSSPRDATVWGACCPQLDGGKAVGDEDCLTLNVWTPKSGTVAPRPVLVFIHGGGNIQGCSAHEALGQRTYEGDVLASAYGAVVVTLNYRLGVLGFLEHEALGPESTNLGLRDQVLALAWVQKNIAAFGGDPKRVLLFGESAGAEDTCAHVVSPQSKGLFSRAIMESAMCPIDDLATMRKAGEDIARKVGCGGGDVAACLRSKPAKDLVKDAPGATLFEKGIKYAPVVDETILVDDPLKTIAKGAHNHVPFAVGDNSAETLLWVRETPLRGELAYRMRIEEMLGKAVGEEVLRRYPVSTYADAKEAFVAATTDAVFVCPARALARALSKSQTEPVYRYYFSHALETRSRAKESGAIHGLELLFVFGHLHPNGYRPTEGEEALASLIQGYWTSFAGAGDPNDARHAASPTDVPVKRVRWERYDANQDDYVTLDDAPKMASALHSANCDFWDGVGATRRSE
jgi:para-nitrobenzyl esterase